MCMSEDDAKELNDLVYEVMQEEIAELQKCLADTGQVIDQLSEMLSISEVEPYWKATAEMLLVKAGELREVIRYYAAAPDAGGAGDDA